VTFQAASVCDGKYDDGIAGPNPTRCTAAAGCGYPGCPSPSDVTLRVALRATELSPYRGVVLYVLGEPGVGKTTLVRQLMYDAFKPSVKKFTEPPDPKWTTVDDEICAAGYYRGTAFDGADTIPYNGARAALEFWAKRYRDRFPLTILDGARFSTRPSLDAIRRLAPDHAIAGVHLVGGAEARRDQRSAITGKVQRAEWVKGAATAARNFAQLIDATEISASHGTTHPNVAHRVRQLVESARRR
jgi:hypothetical protein